MALTPASVVNQALALIVGQNTVTGTPPTFDGSEAGLAAGAIYNETVQMLLRGQDFECSLAVAALTASNGTPPPQWSYEYVYPADCLRVRQVQPPTWVANDPQAIVWDVGFSLTSSPNEKVIWCNVASARLAYTTSAITEAQWDPVFATVVIRALASQLATALGGRLDMSRKYLGDVGEFAQSGYGRDS